MPAAFIRADSLYAWKGSSVLITTARGDCDATLPLAGYYYREARFVRTLRIEVNGQAPWLCESAVVAPDTLTLTYVHPEITEPGGGGTGQAGDEEGTDAHGLPERALDLQLSYRVGAARLEATLLITNRARRSLTFDVACAIDTDFADIQEAQSTRREQQADVVSRLQKGVLEFAYEHPQLPYRGDVVFAGGWEAVEPFAGRVQTKLTLAPREARELSLRVIPHVNGAALSDAELRERDEV